jgi:NitT/TauT family transport system substrate-binding protein
MAALSGTRLGSGVWKAFVVAACLAVAGCGSDSDATGGGGGDRLAIGYVPEMNSGSLVALAADQKLWDDAGLDVETKSFTNGPAQIQAMAAGDIDMAYLGPGALWLPASGKATIVTIDSPAFGDYVIARPDSGIKTVADLKGKKVGVPEGTSGEMILQLALERAGLSPSDIRLVNLDPTSIVPAYTSGQIDAAGIWAPPSTQMSESVDGTKVIAEDKDFYPEYVFFGMWVASSDLVKSQPDLVKKFLSVHRKVADYRAAHVGEAVQTTASFIKAPADQLQSQADLTEFLTGAETAKTNTDGSLGKWAEGLQKLFVKMAQLESVSPADSFIDTSLYPK